MKVDVKYQEVYPDAVKETPLEFWAGFIGLEQNNKTFAPVSYTHLGVPGLRW